MRIAYITPWKDHNALSAYAFALRPHLGEMCRVFAEYKDDAEEEEGVVRCWRRGEALDDLVTQVRKWEPDVVLIEHQYALYPDQAEWLALLEALSIADIYVRLHCVYTTPLNLLGVEEGEKYLKSIPNVLVHTDLAQKVLAKRGVPSEVIPHGIADVVGQSHQPHKPYLFSFGFGAHYKGVENALEVVKILRSSFPDVTYVGVFGEEGYAAKHYLKQINTKVEQEQLDAHVILFNSYKPLATLRRFAQWCSVALFTYNTHDDAREVYGASGAARHAISWGLPVVTSEAPLFSDLLPHVAHGATPVEIADRVRTLLYTPYARDKAYVLQREFAETQSWAVVGRAHLNLFNKSN